MKRRLLYLIAIYAGFLVLFILEKPLFMFFQNKELLAGVTAGDWFRVMWHGLSLDSSVAAYLTLFPWLTVFVSIWVTGGKWPGVANRIYFIFISLFLSAVFIGNMVLYRYWGFPLDATPLFYLRNPGDALASAPGWFVIVGIMFVIVVWLLINRGLGFFTRRFMDGVKPMINRVWWSALMVLLGGVLFLGMRGGITQSTANVGRVYFSNNMFLNHSAVNPAFSLLESLNRERNFATHYKFFPEAERAAIFDSLKAPAADSIHKVLTTDRPDIVLVLLESFTMNILEEKVDGTEVTPRINALRDEGIWFPEFYANSFRTDRGLVSILNGYPAQPVTSIMKYPAKSQTLPSIAKSLKGAGYSTEMIYGGDIDFTNMRSYFYSSGYTKVTGSDGLRLSAKKSEWGYDDGDMFVETLRRIKEKPAGERHFTTLLTLSSHEPFRVPFDRFADPVLNSMAYTDECLGGFIEGLRQLPGWDNMLVILVADHALTWPRSLRNFDPGRHHIPMIWTGGAMAGSLTVLDRWCQVDIASTLLGQMGLDDGEFIFSHDIFNPNQLSSAFYTFNNGFGYMDGTGATVQDCDSDRSLIIEGEKDGYMWERERKGKAILQTLMEDMEQRGR